jgi:hypothetical protein
MKRNITVLAFFLFSLLTVIAQNNTKPNGVILSVETEQIYLDLKQGQVEIGDKYKVTKGGGFFIHPVSGEKIAKKEEIVANIEITEVNDSYSTAKVFPAENIMNLSKGMTVKPLEATDKIAKKKVIFVPFNIVGDGGNLGRYMAESMMQEFLGKDCFKIIDTQGLDASNNSAIQDYVVQNNIDYIIGGTATQPEVTETQSGAPIKGILMAGELITGKNLGSSLASDVKKVQMKAIANITIKLMDARSNEVLFNAREMSMQSGMSSLELEQGVLGGSRVQGGLAGFYQSVAGQATQVAVKQLSNYLMGFLDGTIKEKNYKGNIIQLGTTNKGNKRGNNELKIVNVFDPIPTDKETYYEVTTTKGRRVNKNKIYNVYIREDRKSEITGNVLKGSYKRYGKLKITKTEEDGNRGLISIKKDKSVTKEDILSKSRLKFRSKPNNFEYTNSILLGHNLVSVGYGLSFYKRYGDFLFGVGGRLNISGEIDTYESEISNDHSVAILPQAEIKVFYQPSIFLIGIGYDIALYNPDDNYVTDHFYGYDFYFRNKPELLLGLKFGPLTWNCGLCFIDYKKTESSFNPHPNEVFTTSLLEKGKTPFFSFNLGLMF